MDKMLKIAVMLTAVDKMTRVIHDAVGASSKKLDAFQKKASENFLKGGAMVGTGAAILGSLKPAIDAYASLEEAQTDLKVSLMKEGGVVSDAMKQYDALANKLGNTLPGSTETFYNMLANLNKQGISSKGVLGGIGEAAANASVLWKISADDAAVFMAKMSDATKTTEKDFGALTDTLNRAFFKGVNNDNQLAFFSKLAPALKTAHMEGLQAVKTFSPLMIMLDQAGMKGEAAGNAVRKIIQATVDSKKVAEGNALGGVNLSFLDKNGNFAGFANMYKEIEKLKGLSDTKRDAVIGKIFGDDAETMQALNLMMQGRKAYNDASKAASELATSEQMLAEVKKTLNVSLDNLGGNFQNLKAIIGGGVAPAVQFLADKIADLTAWFQKLFAENPALGRFIGMVVALSGSAMMLWGVVSVIKGISIALRVMNMTLFASPWFWVAAAAIAVIALIYAHWGKISKFFSGLWDDIVAIWRAGIAWIKDNWGKLLLGLVFPLAGVGMLLVAAIKKWFPDLYNAGAEVITGLWNGMKSKFTEMLDGIKNLGHEISAKFKDVLGIKSPSRVFMQHGMHISHGAFLGMEKGKSLVQKGAQALGTAMMPRPAQAVPAMAGGRSGGGVTVQMNINVSGGATAAQANSFIAELRKNKSEITRIVQEATAQRERRTF